MAPLHVVEYYSASGGPSFHNSSNTSPSKFWMGQNKCRLDPSIVFAGMSLIGTLTRGNPPITFHGAISSLTESARKGKLG